MQNNQTNLNNQNVSENNATSTKNANELTNKQKLELAKKKQAKAQTARFKAQYFEYYDDIKISDRQDW